MPRWSLLLLIVCAPPLTTAQCTRAGKSVSACLKQSQVSSHAPAGRFERCVYCYKKDTDKDGQCQGCHQCTTKLRRGDLSNCMYWPEQVLEQPAKNLSDKQARDLGRTLRHHEFVAMLSKDQKTDPKPVHPLCYAASCSAEGVPAWLQQVPNMIDPACKQDEPSQPSVEDAGDIDEAVKELQAAAPPSEAAAPLASPDPLLLPAPAPVPMPVPVPAPAQPVAQPVVAQPVDTQPEEVQPVAQPVDAQPVDTQPEEVQPVAKPVDTQPEEVQPVAQPVVAQPMDTQPEEVQPVAQPVDAQPEEVQPVDAQPVDTQPEEVQPVAQPVDTQPEEVQPVAQPVDAQPPAQRVRRHTLVISGNFVGELADPSEPASPTNTRSWPLPSTCTTLGNSTKGSLWKRTLQKVICGPRLRTSNLQAPLLSQQPSSQQSAQKPLETDLPLQSLEAAASYRLGEHETGRRPRDITAAALLLQPRLRRREHSQLEQDLDDEQRSPLEPPGLANFERSVLEEIASAQRHARREAQRFPLINEQRKRGHVPLHSEQ